MKKVKLTIEFFDDDKTSCQWEISLKRCLLAVLLYFNSQHIIKFFT